MPLGRKGRTGWILLTAAALLVGLAVVGWSFMRDGELTAGAPGTASGSAAGGPSASPLNRSRAARLSEQLTSGKEAELRAALALPSDQALEPAAVKQLASLGSISFDLDTFTYLDGQTAEVQGVVDNPPDGTIPNWTFTVLYLGREWKLVDGRPKG
ncbi:hypothetical protein [Micromonospora sp. NPDC005707]|uniref:hypothetical protein n=1 Tax=Micromonospora sp. NPDC005707 TaxID=3157050 RepID=UPI0033F1DD55